MLGFAMHLVCSFFSFQCHFSLCLFVCERVNSKKSGLLIVCVCVCLVPSYTGAVHRFPVCAAEHR